MPISYSTAGSKYSLRVIQGNNPGEDIPTGLEAFRSDLEGVMAAFSQGTLASRPTSTSESPGKTGRFYYATDVKVLYYDTGTSWISASGVGAWETLTPSTGFAAPSEAPIIVGGTDEPHAAQVRTILGGASAEISGAFMTTEEVLERGHKHIFTLPSSLTHPAAFVVRDVTVISSETSVTQLSKGALGIKPSGEATLYSERSIGTHVLVTFGLTYPLT